LGALLGALAALLAAVLALGGCEDGTAPAGGGGRLTVVATTGMVADVARNVAGDRANVRSLMGEGVDPHLYKASPGDVRALREAGLVLYNGLMLEGRMADVLERLGTAVAVTDRIPKERLLAAEDYEGHPDPHVWFDVSLWRLVVERVRDALSERDPAGREAYSANAAAYLRRLDELHAWCAAELAPVPAERRVLVTAHDAFGYFGRAYGVEVRGIQGVSTDSEVPLSEVKALVELLVTRRVGAVFVESSVPRRSVEALIEGAAARGHAVVVGGELFSDAMGPEGTPEGTYIGMVRHNVSAIAAALRGGSGAGEGPGKERR
jgi:manganese/zinc/iron transport system substrate-binding protein